jgi:hypothetical protein
MRTYLYCIKKPNDSILRAATNVHANEMQEFMFINSMVEDTLRDKGELMKSSIVPRTTQCVEYECEAINNGIESSIYILALRNE